MVDYRAGIANTQDVSEHLVVSEDRKVLYTHIHPPNCLSFSLLCLCLTHTHFVSLSGVFQRDAGAARVKNKIK